MKKAILCAAAVFALAAGSAMAEMIWVEGESAQSREVYPNPGLDQVDRDELSGGEWISSFSENGKPAGTAKYLLSVKKAGKYDLWVRANPGMGLAYRIADGAWVAIDGKGMEKADQAAQLAWRRNRSTTKGPSPRSRVVDTRPVSLDATPGFRTLAWICAGTLELNPGEQQIEFLLGSDGKSTAEKMFNNIDVFVLTDDATFVPHAKFKPGEDWEKVLSFASEQVWEFRPTKDELSAEALLDLRSLNEDVAGQHGFIGRSKDGMEFVRGDGEPIRFWGGSDYAQRNLKYDDMVRHVEFLAKRGVNILRWHGDLPPDPPKKGEAAPPISAIDEKELDEAFKLVAAAKQAGIYTVLSPYWGSHTKVLDTWEFPDSRNLSGLVFFHPKVQEAYKNWVRTLYTRPNPYTGIPLKDEPAVAIIQIQNEDSMLFFTMQAVKGEPLMVLRKQYAQWVNKKYGSYVKAMDAWKGYAHPEDDANGGIPGMFIVWEFTAAARAEKGGAAGREQRLSDQLQFMAETMYNWNKEVARFLREEIGAKQLINAGNWKSVDYLSEDAERWSYTANEVLGKNHYFGGQHKGINDGWQILPHQYYTNVSTTRSPESLPVNVRQAVGYPFIIPESLWVPPLQYQSEGPLMVAAQTSLTGVDTFYWFCTHQAAWQEPVAKWTFETPMLLGQFPATALLYRKGYIKPGEPVVVEQKSLADIWGRTAPLIAEGRAWDPNRDQGDMPEGSSIKSAIDPLAFMVGPVQVNYGGDPRRSYSEDLSKYIDRDRKTVQSKTGELRTEFGAGVYTVNAAKAQGAAGFLGKAGAVSLGDLAVECSNEYATIVAVSLDDQPLAISKRVLLQIGTVSRPTGWKARPAKFLADNKLVEGYRIIATGQSPWQIEKAAGTVTLKNAGIKKATVLDENGMAKQAIELKREGNQVKLQLPSDALYVVLSAD